uniref:GLOBIN domain-containing protein n=1 Tax=Elaeophora elaphi TaxID=1147741 RepID=A0A0R3RXY3_9BILA
MQRHLYDKPLESLIHSFFQMNEMNTLGNRKIQEKKYFGNEKAKKETKRADRIKGMRKEIKSPIVSLAVKFLYNYSRWAQIYMSFTYLQIGILLTTLLVRSLSFGKFWMIVAARFTSKARQSVVSDKKKSEKSHKDGKRNSTPHQTLKFINDRFRSHSPWSDGNSNEQHSVSALQAINCRSATNLRYVGTNRWGLLYQQTLALKITWNKLCKTPHSACRGISAIMGEKNKALRDIFYNVAFVNGIAEHRTIATLHDHSHFFISLISQIIQSLDSESDDIFKHIDKIGLCHSGLAKYGFERKLWDQLGEELVDVLVVQNCVRSFPGSCRAWTVLIANLIDHLSAATTNSYSTGKSTKSQHRSKSA